MELFYVLCFLVLLAIIMFVEILIGLLIKKILGKVTNNTAKIFITIFLYCIFLPCMVAVYNSESVTPSESKLAPFSYSLHSKSKLLILINLLYALGIYALYSKFA